MTWLLLRQRCDWRLGIRGPVCTGVASLITVLSPQRGWRGSFSLCSERSLLPHACRSSGVLERGWGGGGGRNAIRAFFGPTNMKSHQDRNEDFINLHGCSVPAEQFVFRDICSTLVYQGLPCAGFTRRNPEPRAVDLLVLLLQASLKVLQLLWD